MGRPKFVIDEELVKKLAALHCTYEEMAFACGCSVRTFIRQINEQGDLKESLEAGKAGGKLNLRRLRWRSANNVFKGGGQDGCSTGPAVQMQLHLSKHWLGETDKAAMELTGPGGKELKPGVLGQASVVVFQLPDNGRS